MTEAELTLLPAWREAPTLSAAERATLAWAEALTQLTPLGVDDALYAEMQVHFDSKRIADLSFAVAEINAWNRLMVAFAHAAAVSAAHQTSWRCGPIWSAVTRWPSSLRGFCAALGQGVR